MPRNLRNLLEAAGWTEDRSGFVHPGGEFRVDLSGDYGFAWELQRFSDRDTEGVAAARWIAMDVEGDTADELVAALDACGLVEGERHAA